jgi:hypothetical protein
VQRAVFSLLVVGFALIVTGIAFIYWPAAIIVAGVFIVLLAALVDLDTPEKPEGIEVVDETDESMPVIARIKG